MLKYKFSNITYIKENKLYYKKYPYKILIKLADSGFTRYSGIYHFLDEDAISILEQNNAMDKVNYDNINKIWQYMKKNSKIIDICIKNFLNEKNIEFKILHNSGSIFIYLRNTSDINLFVDEFSDCINKIYHVENEIVNNMIEKPSYVIRKTLYNKKFKFKVVFYYIDAPERKEMAKNIISFYDNFDEAKEKFDFHFNENSLKKDYWINIGTLLVKDNDSLSLLKMLYNEYIQSIYEAVTKEEIISLNEQKSEETVC